MEIITEAGPLARYRGCVFVPTMGALHEGHASLIRQAADESRRRGGPGCLVSIFVNPTQFNERADFERYPRTFEADAALCVKAGAAAVFAPPVEAVYPPGHPPPVPSLPLVAFEPGLEDRFRPGHFAGVCQVVSRLFDLVQPSAAIFGEKDWQQYRVVSKMTRELALREVAPPVEIIPGPTVRENDGLAMSSRNRFMSSDERRRAASIPLALAAAQSHNLPEDAETAMSRVLAEAGLQVEYAVVRDPHTLVRLNFGVGRALVAVCSGSVRLIDNGPWGNAWYARP